MYRKHIKEKMMFSLPTHPFIYSMNVFECSSVTGIVLIILQHSILALRGISLGETKVLKVLKVAEEML